MTQGLQFQNNIWTDPANSRQTSLQTNTVNSAKTNTVNSTQTNTVNNSTAKIQSQPEEDTFISTVKGAGPWLLLFEGIPLFKYLKNNKLIAKFGNKETLNFAKKASKTITKTNKTALKALTDKSNGSLLKRIGKYIGTADETKKAYQSVRSAVNTEGKAAKITKKIVEKTAKGKSTKHLEKKIR